MIRRRMWFLVLLAAAAFCAACRSGPTDSDFPTDTHAVVGTMIHVMIRDDGNVQLILGECELEPSLTDHRPDTVGVFVHETVPVWVRGPNASLRPGTKEDFVEGGHVRTYYSGIMLRSDPPGVIASGVEIIKKR